MAMQREEEEAKSAREMKSRSKWRFTGNVCRRMDHNTSYTSKKKYFPRKACFSRFLLFLSVINYRHRSNSIWAATHAQDVIEFCTCRYRTLLLLLPC